MPRKRHQTGGANIYGTDVRNISKFTPSQIPDLIFWIQADPATTTQETIQEYANKQLLTLQESLEKQFSSRLQEKVITAIQSKADTPNSLIRLEIDDTLPSTFPVYKSYPDRLDAFDVSNLFDPNSKQEQRLKLVSTDELQLPDKFSVYTISHGVKIQYLNSLDKIMVVAEFVPTPTTTLVENTPQAVPTAEFSEIIIYSRALTEDEDQLLRGYLAYRENNQYVLESSNPYIPDKMAEPALEPIAKRLKAVEDAVGISVTTMGTAYTTRVENTGEDTITRQYPEMEKLGEELKENILELKNTLSRGVLAAKEKTLEGIFSAINEKTMYPVPISQSIVDTKMGEFEGGQTKLKQYADSLSAQTTPSSITLHKEKIELEKTEKQDMQTTEIMNTTKREVDARTFYQGLYKTRTSLELYGKSFYKSLYQTMSDTIDSTVDTFEYHFSTAERGYMTVVNTFTPVYKDFESGKIMNGLKGYDMTILGGAPDPQAPLKGGGKDSSGNFVLDQLVQPTAPKTIQYRDPFVNSLQTRYETLRNCILYGDFVYLYQTIERIYAYILELQDCIEAGDIHPVLQPLYESIYIERFTYFKLQIDSFTTLQKDVLAELSDFSDALRFRANGITTVSSLQNPYTYIDSVKPLYIRRVHSMDTLLCGFEYIITDKAGSPARPFPEIWFPEFASVEYADGKYSYATPYFSGENPIVQTYTEVEPYTESILESLEPVNKPSMIPVSITQTYEIPIQQMNSIFILKTEMPCHRVLLPVYGLTPNQSVVLFNSGPVPIPVIIPGTATDYTDTIGPGTGTVYIYGKADDYYYGKVPWIGTMIAYDSILDCPRTSVCAFLEDINKYVYVYSLKPSRKLYTALLDSAGEAIEVKRHTDTYVYDIDDAFNCCPYIVSSVMTTTSAALRAGGPADRKTLTLREQPAIKVAEETTTHMPVLCNSKGIPGINQYGYIRVCQNPILQIKGELKTRGAYGDILLETIPPVKLASVQLERYTSFEYLFRPMFAIQAGTDFIFATYSTFPIATPSGDSVLVESIKKHGVSILYYDDGSAANNAYIIDAPSDQAQRPKKSYPFSDIEAYMNAENHRTIITTSIQHYRSSLAYIDFLLADLSGNTKILQSFDAEETANTLQTIGSCVELITQEKTKLQSLSSSLAQMEANPTVIMGDTRIALDTMHVSLASSLKNVQNANSLVAASMQEFTEAIQGIQGVKKQEESLIQRGSELFKNSITTLHTKIQEQIIARGTTGAPDLEVLLKKIVSVQTDFTAAMTSIHVSIQQQPTYMNDIRSWLKDIWSRLGDANILLQNVDQIVSVETDKAINGYKRKEDIHALYSSMQEVEATYKQLASKRTAAETSMEHLKPTLQEGDPIYGAYQAVEKAFEAPVDTEIRKLKTSLLDETDKVDDMKAALEKIRGALPAINSAIEDFSAKMQRPAPES